MDTYVLAIQDRDGTRRFYAPSLTPPWSDNLNAAGQYVRRYEAETDARVAGALVMTWSDAWAVAFSADAIPA